MSYDLRIWSIEPCVDVERHRRAGKGWLIDVGASDPVMTEDIDDDVLPLLPGVRYLTHLHLEGERTRPALAALHRAARALATASKGAIEDPQDDSVTLPSGLKRWLPPTRGTAPVALLELSWWLDRSLLDRRVLDRVLDVVERHLPEAMPRRYGPYEPPAHVLAQTGRAHLLDFLVASESTGPVLYPHPPVAHVSLTTHRAPCWIDHGARRTFRCHRFTIAIERAVLDLPGWPTGLDRAWRALSAELRPFYGDVRTTHGHVRSKNGRWWTTGSTEAHPIRAWWFGGVPARMGHAAVVGEPYLGAWPELEGHGERVGGLRFLSTPDWRLAIDIADAVGGVPDRHRLDESASYPERYPPAFPFPDR
jgi:hypothetical protein